MDPRMIRSPWARLAFASLAAMWSAAGWMILIDGGFTKSYRYSKETIRVEGSPGLALAFIFFLLSAIAIAVALRSAAVRDRWVVAAASLVIAAPAFHLLTR